MLTASLIKQKEVWEKFLLSYCGANFLQSYNWGEFQSKMGVKVWRLALFEDGKIVGVAQFYKESAKRGPYLACPGGPLFDYSTAKQLQFFLKYLKTLAKKEKVWFFRCRPQELADNDSLKLFNASGFLPAPMHMEAEQTLQLDLDSDHDALLLQMRKNTRYAVKKAIKNKVKVIISSDLDDIDLLYKLQMETKKKHDFVPFSKLFLKEQFRAFVHDKQALIFKAYVGNILCAIAFVIFYKNEAVYHYAGSNKLAYQNNSSYLIQWEAIKEAKKRGMKKYNFWGIAPLDQPKHRFYGVSIFKRGFGGKTVSYLHAQDLPLSRFYYLTRAFEAVRKKMRHL